MRPLIQCSQCFSALPGDEVVDGQLGLFLVSFLLLLILLLMELVTLCFLSFSSVNPCCSTSGNGWAYSRHHGGEPATTGVYCGTSLGRCGHVSVPGKTYIVHCGSSTCMALTLSMLSYHGWREPSCADPRTYSEDPFGHVWPPYIFGSLVSLIMKALYVISTNKAFPMRKPLEIHNYR